MGNVCCGWGTTAYRGIVWEMCAVAGYRCPTVFGSFLLLSDGNVWVYIVGARKYIMGGIPGKSGEGAFPQGNVCCGWGTTAYRGIVWEMCAVA